jgi:3D (Asp-Asp-Asp) domain-containing protein
MRTLLMSAAVATAMLAGLSLPSAAHGRVPRAEEDLAVGRMALVRDTESDRLRLRVGPGLSQTVQGTVLEGTRVQIVDGPQVADGHQWFRVSAPAGVGWVSARYLAPVDERAVTAAARGPMPPGSGRAVPMRVTAYHLGNHSRTATGTTPRWGTVAVDPQVIPLGSRLLIEGFEGTTFIAEDTGSAVRGHIVDVWFEDLAAARRYGTQSRTVTILEQR